MKIFHYQKGFTTNSSSSHSILFVKGKHQILDDMRNAILGEYGWNRFVLASKGAKIDYIRKQLRGTEYENIVNLLFGKINEPKTKEGWYEEGYIDHNSQWIFPQRFLGTTEEEYVAEFLRFIVDDGTIILGGNDNDDSFEEEFTQTLDQDKYVIPHYNIYKSYSRPIIRLDNKYGFYTMFIPDCFDPIKTRFSFNNMAKIPTQASTPELVDLKITERCTKGCAFCLDDSTLDGKHANIDTIKHIIDVLASLHVLEIAIGGGEPTSHPNIKEIIKYAYLNKISVSLSTTNIDWIINNVKFINSYCGGIGISCANAKEVKTLLGKLYGKNVLHKITIHIVLGTLDRDEFAKILDELSNVKYCNRVLLLAPKSIGRGETYKFQDYSWWLEEVKKYERLIYRVSIDTELARLFENELKDTSGELSPILYDTTDGKFSMFIDAVNMEIAPSSFSDQKVKIDGNLFETISIVFPFTT
jgi:hypothetical protein